MISFTHFGLAELDVSTASNCLEAATLIYRRTATCVSFQMRVTLSGGSDAFSKGK